MDITSILMFSFVFVIGFVFSLLGIMEMTFSIEKKKSPFAALLFCMLAAVVWFPFATIWFVTADVTMYFGFGYLWLALGFVFTALTLLAVGLQLRQSIRTEEEKPDLEIRERVA